MPGDDREIWDREEDPKPTTNSAAPLIAKIVGGLLCVGAAVLVVILAVKALAALVPMTLIIVVGFVLVAAVLYALDS